MWQLLWLHQMNQTQFLPLMFTAENSCPILMHGYVRKVGENEKSMQQSMELTASKNSLQMHFHLQFIELQVHIGLISQHPRTPVIQEHNRDGRSLTSTRPQRTTVQVQLCHHMSSYWAALPDSKICDNDIWLVMVQHATSGITWRQLLGCWCADDDSQVQCKWLTKA